VREPSDPIRSSGYDAEGFAEVYDAYRPAPPAIVLDVLCRVAHAPRPRVVDLGAGTGLSTRAWAGRAEGVVGVEPQEPMLRRAEAATAATNVRYVLAYGDDTGLPDASADIVTCSQSFHWMEPGPTLAEAARLLRPGGVFAAYDYDVPPVLFDLETERAFAALVAVRRRRRAELGIPAGAHVNPKERHLDEIRSSARFRFARELVLHHEGPTSADRVVGFAESIGPAAARLGVTEDELGLTALREAAAQAAPTRWLLGYRIRLGIV
jgi:SAM-dependent methyltransferase